MVFKNYKVKFKIYSNVKIFYSKKIDGYKITQTFKNRSSKHMRNR
jgi:hypothetical protein